MDEVEDKEEDLVIFGHLPCDMEDEMDKNIMSIVLPPSLHPSFAAPQAGPFFSADCNV